MVRQNKIYKKPRGFRKGLIQTALLLLLGMIAWPGLAQFNTEYNNIYLSGQITNSTNGAPIADKQIFILSDSTGNNGFYYYATAVTDANGFYYDTIVTTQNDGHLKIYLFDYYNNPVEAIQYYRFLWEDDYLMFADFEIFDPNITVSFQANFYSEPDPYSGNPLMISFHDISIGFQLKSWIWDFGDGVTSTLQDPMHEYAEPGIYMVTLVVSSQPPTQEFYMSSTMTKQVKVGQREYHHMGGHVFADYFPIDLGFTYLYMYDEDNNLIPIDTTPIDTLGYYYFYQLPEGKYITKSRLQAGSSLYGQFMPTYIGNVYVWSQAAVVTLDNDNWECDIHLIQSVGATSGEAKILGQINYDTARNANSIVPAGNIEIVLLNEQGSCLTCGLSDMEGYFQFANLAYGTYLLYPDVAGIRNDIMQVTVSEEKPIASDVSLVINLEEITFSVNEHQSEFVDGAILIYPNPAQDKVRLVLDMKKGSTVHLVLTDLGGRIITRLDVTLDQGNRELTLDVSNLSAGLYQVVMIPQDGVKLTSKLMKTN